MKTAEVTYPTKRLVVNLHRIIYQTKSPNKKIKNPETGKMIKIKTALGYEKDKPAFKAAQFAIKKK
jgi:hypothetical protein